MFCCCAKNERPPRRAGEPPAAAGATGAGDVLETRVLQSTLVRKDRSKVEGSTLKGKTVGVYVSAHWCPPCRAFTPVLKAFYEEYKKLNPDFEIVFVSSDRDEEGMWSYFAEHGDYLVASYGGQARTALKQHVSCSGIPTLAIYNGNDGSLITKNGRAKVNEGAAAVHKNGW